MPFRCDTDGCSCGRCTHRSYTATPELVWSGGVTPRPGAAALDVHATAAALYVVGATLVSSLAIDFGPLLVQKWTTGGSRVWSVNLSEALGLPADGHGRAIDAAITSDDATVWAVIRSGVASGVGNFRPSHLAAFDAFDGTLLWGTPVGPLGGWDVVHDGEGRVYVPHEYLADTPPPDPACDEDDYYYEPPRRGWVSQYDEAGALRDRFGGKPQKTAYAVAWMDGALYVASQDYKARIEVPCCESGMPTLLARECGQDGFVTKYVDHAPRWVWYSSGQHGFARKIDAENGKLAVAWTEAPNFFNPFTGEVTAVNSCVQLWDVSGELPAVLWSRKFALGENECSATRVHVNGIALDETRVYAVACRFLQAWNHAGELQTASENAPPIEPQEANQGVGYLHSVSTPKDGSGAVYTGGISVPCAVEDEIQGREDGDCPCEPGCEQQPCADNAKGERVIPGCDPEKGIPCHVQGRAAWTGCLESWPEPKFCRISTPTLPSEAEWHHWFVWECGGKLWDIALVVANYCIDDYYGSPEPVWSARFQYRPHGNGLWNEIEGAATIDPESLTCEGPDGHPALRINFALTAQQASEAFSTCDDGHGHVWSCGTGSIGFGMEPGEPGEPCLCTCCCEPVPCAFDAPLFLDCLGGFEGQSINVRWTGGSGEPPMWGGVSDTIECDTGNFRLLLTATRTCDGLGWQIGGRLQNMGTLADVPLSITVEQVWCTDEAPPVVPFPGFRWSFTVANEVLAAIGFDGCCPGDLRGCSPEPCGIEACDCNMPPTFYATISNVVSTVNPGEECGDGGTTPVDASIVVTLNHVGGQEWRGSQTFCGGMKSFYVAVICDGGAWRWSASTDGSYYGGAQGFSSVVCSPVLFTGSGVTNPVSELALDIEVTA